MLGIHEWHSWNIFGGARAHSQRNSLTMTTKCRHEMIYYFIVSAKVVTTISLFYYVVFVRCEWMRQTYVCQRKKISSTHFDALEQYLFSAKWTNDARRRTRTYAHIYNISYARRFDGCNRKQDAWGVEMMPPVIGIHTAICRCSNWLWLFSSNPSMMTVVVWGTRGLYVHIDISIYICGFLMWAFRNNTALLHCIYVW